MVGRQRASVKGKRGREISVSLRGEKEERKVSSFLLLWNKFLRRRLFAFVLARGFLNLLLPVALTSPGS